MPRTKVRSEQYTEDNYTSTSWKVNKVGSLRIATRKVNIGAINATTSTSISITLPDGKTYSQIDSLTSHVNNPGAYVEYIVVGTQYSSSNTAANLWVRNTGAGTSGAVEVNLIAVYTA